MAFGSVKLADGNSVPLVKVIWPPGRALPAEKTIFALGAPLGPVAVTVPVVLALTPSKVAVTGWPPSPITYPPEWFVAGLVKRTLPSNTRSAPDPVIGPENNSVFDELPTSTTFSVLFSVTAPL